MARGSAEGALRPERELTLKAAAEMTGISGKILSRYIREGRLEPAGMDGNRLMVTIAALRSAGLLASGAPDVTQAPGNDAAPSNATRAADRLAAAGASPTLEKLERERLAREKGEREKAERQEQARLEQDRLRVEAERQRVEAERIERESHERDRAAAEREKAEREKAEREKAEREQAEREKAEREKAEHERAEREKAPRKRSHVVTRPLGRAAAATPEIVDDLDRAETESLKAPGASAGMGDAPEAILPDAIEPELMPASPGDESAPAASGLPPSTGQLVSAGQIQDLLSRLLSEREARSQEWQQRAESLYREMIDEQRLRIAALEEEKRSLDASLRDALQMVPKGVDLRSLEEQNRDLRIELDRRDAARVALEADRDRNRDLVDRLKSELSRSEKRNLDLAEAVRRLRARGLWDRITGTEADER